MRSDSESTRSVYIATTVASIGGLLYGYDLTVVSGAVLFIKKQFHLSPFLEETTISIALLGAMIGAFSGGFVIDKIGRRKIIIIAALVSIIGEIISSIGLNVLWVIIGRAIVGFGFGIISFSVPLYISEIAPVRIRGWLVSVYTVLFVTGALISFIVDFAFSKMAGWRWMFSLAMIPAIILGVGMVFMPSSPRWLLKKGMIDKARKVLIKIRGKTSVEDELRSIQETVTQESPGFADLLKPMLKPVLILGVGLGVLRQLTGANIASFYSPTIFGLAGFGSASVDILATVGVGVALVLGTILAMQLVDRIGRRPLMLTGLIGMGLSLAVLGLVFYLPDIPRGLLKWGAFIGVMAFTAVFAAGPSAVSQLVISEIFPLNIRGLAVSISIMALWAAYLLTSVTFLTLIQILGRSGTFWLYGFVCFAAFLFVYFRMPETKDKSLEEIEEFWQPTK
ncbi:sugar porter family MFS transporter [Desulfobacterota bacterium AH_259_B03_O07]|nr:sugar porter family MFS transporter [Desulfobacterota bacterium AH_259_B03_O07]